MAQIGNSIVFDMETFHQLAHGVVNMDIVGLIANKTYGVVGRIREHSNTGVCVTRIYTRAIAVVDVDEEWIFFK